MIILKHSYLDSRKNLVKTLLDGKYGMYDLAKKRQVVVPSFECLQYHEQDDLIWARLDSFYFIIDKYGEMVGAEMIAENNWEYIDKHDRCPACDGRGCDGCFNGSIPLNGDFSHYDAFDF